MVPCFVRGFLRQRGVTKCCGGGQSDSQRHQHSHDFPPQVNWCLRLYIGRSSTLSFGPTPDSVGPRPLSRRTAARFYASRSLLPGPPSPEASRPAAGRARTPRRCRCHTPPRRPPAAGRNELPHKEDRAQQQRDEGQLPELHPNVEGKQRQRNVGLRRASSTSAPAKPKPCSSPKVKATIHGLVIAR